jgi:hypothetical protein
MKAFEVEWNEPGLGVCQAWKVAENWFGFSAPGIEGAETTFERAMQTLEGYIAECNEGSAK